MFKIGEDLSKKIQNALCHLMLKPERALVKDEKKQECNGCDNGCYGDCVGYCYTSCQSENTHYY